MATRRLGNGYSMTKVGTIILTVCFGLAVGTSAQAALNYDPAMRATPYAPPVLDAGWAYDDINAAWVNSVASPYVYNLTGRAVFRITDQFITGDQYKVWDSGVLILTTAPFAGTPFGDDATADAGWSNIAYQGGEVVLGPGAHSITVQGDGVGGIPAGFYVRLDTEAGIPTVSTWGLVVIGLLLLIGAKVYFGGARRAIKPV